MNTNGNLNGSSNMASRLFDQFAAEKKKSIMTLCLIGVMAFMWIRVLSKKGPKTAKSSPLTEVTAEENLDPQVKISFVELPVVDGRNDVLGNDFFVIQPGGFGSGNPENIISGGDLTGHISAIVGKLMLQAIDMGEQPLAFINDKLLGIGEKLFVRNGNDIFECEVIKIEKKKVIVKCEETEILLKLPQIAEAAD